MSIQTIQTAVLQCSFGAAPSPLLVVPKGPPELSSNMPAATILDNVPIVNLQPFGVCSSIANPAVASATAAALGVLTPMPCVPVPVGPWAPGSPTVLINNIPALDNMSKCMCAYGGVIQIVQPGQTTHMIPTGG